jgi:hypothetical protein
MSYSMRVCAMAALLTVGAEAVRAELFVVRVGTGAAALSNASTATFIDRFNDDGSASASPTIALPTAVSGANFQLTNSGSATSEGFIARSVDGNYLTLAGYGADPGVTQIAQTASATTPRVVGRVTIATGVVDTTTALSDAYSGGNIRAAVTTNGTDIWTAGTVQTLGGTRYATLGATTSLQVSGSPTNTRVIDIANSQLYTSSASNPFFGVSTVGTGTPTTSGQTTTLLPGFPTTSSAPNTHSSYDFWFKDANTVYVADDGGFAAAGGIQKWTFDSGAMTWSLAYTLLNTGTATTAVRGLTGVFDGANTTLYATTTATSANKLIKVVDIGAGSMSMDLATAPTNTAFRGVEFVSTGAGPGINANFDGVGGVNGNDFLIWQQGLGSGTTLAQGDSDGNGAVDATDLANWKSQFGTPVVAAAAAVPEPGSIDLAGAALAGALGVARRRSGL